MSFVRRVALPGIVVLWIAGCNSGGPRALSPSPAFTKLGELGEPPACLVGGDSPAAPSGNAGCLVRFGRRLLVVRHVKSGKLTIPGGHGRADESAQCTAHRETWEEAGIQVEVGPLVAHLENGFYLFECRVPASEQARCGRLLRSGTAGQRPQEISRVLLVDATDLTPENYRFPSYLAEVKLALHAMNQRHVTPTLH